MNKAGAAFSCPQLKSHFWRVAAESQRAKLQIAFLLLHVGRATIRRHADEDERQSTGGVFLERSRSAFSLPSPPQGGPKPCRQDADPHTET